MMGKAPTENSKGVRVMNLPQVRDIMNEEFEAMLAASRTRRRHSTRRLSAATPPSRKALGL
jgi:sn-glycerol 3-phosphate transport system substrate-binding protein